MKIYNLIELYKKDYAFRKLAVLTQKSYVTYLDIIAEKYGNRDALKLGERDTVYDFRIYITDIFQTLPRKAKHLLSVFRLFSRWAYRNGFIRRDITDILKLEFKYQVKSLNVWSEADVEFVLQHASKPLQDFILFALETGLRRCDLIKLTFSDIHTIQTHKVFIITQQKTKNQVKIPLSHKLIDWLDKNPPKSEFILNSVDNTPWHEDKFNHAWQRLKKRLKLKNITPHGLRKTAVTRLAKAGCTVPEISAIFGWTIASVQNMLDKHYFQDKLSVAISAIDKLNVSER